LGKKYIIFSNIGGAGTPLAEEFVIILSNPNLKEFDISFLKSFLILFPG
jgi:hypothetical protein